MIYKPETHKTRCGAPWRDLGDNLILVINDEGKRNVVGPIDEFGHFQYYCSLERNKDYDLIPVPHEHNLPTDLPMAAQWAAKDSNNKIFIFDDGGAIYRDGFWRNKGICCCELVRSWPYNQNMLADYSSEDSLHKRTYVGGWEWVPKGISECKII